MSTRVLVRAQYSNANQLRNDSEMKEISAQKLCAGTVSDTTHRAGGLYWRLSVMDTPGLAKLLILLPGALPRRQDRSHVLQRTNRTIQYFGGACIARPDSSRKPKAGTGARHGCA